MPEPTEDSLAVLLLPGKLEGFELEAHARDLLSIPRVIALEPSRFRTPRFLRNAVGMRQARRLPFPGRPRMIVLYHPAQYPLARALLAHDEELELWYVSSPTTRACLTPPSCATSTTSHARTPPRLWWCVVARRSKTRTFASECGSWT